MGGRLISAMAGTQKNLDQFENWFKGNLSALLARRA
jgi:hypothetical protein